MTDKPADVYTYRAAALLGIPADEVTEAQRIEYIASLIGYHERKACSPCAGHALQSDLDEALES